MPERSHGAGSGKCCNGEMYCDEIDHSFSCSSVMQSQYM